MPNCEHSLFSSWHRTRECGPCRSQVEGVARQRGRYAKADDAADFGKFIADETEKWGKVVKFAGLKAD